MSEPFVAEIRIFAGNFAPKSWAMCNGQILPISQNTALFSLLGTYYGGDGKSTFALPDLQSRVPIGAGQGPGLTDRFLGEEGGSNAVALLTSEIPSHTHTLQGANAPLKRRNPTNALLTSVSGANVYAATAPDTLMASEAVGITGSSLPHNNMQPYLTLNFIIALQGIYPARG